MSTPRTQQSARLDGLDGLRGVAAVAVALFHYTALYPGGHATTLLVTVPGGFLGVDLFFLLSGFVILMTTERASSLSGFVRARVIRLWPAFIVCCLASSAVLWLDDGALPDPLRLAGNLTMVPIFLRQTPIDGSYWSLGCEIVFYGLIALALLRARMAAERFCLLWLGLAAICLALEPMVPGRLLYLIAPRFAPLFVIGMIANRLHTGRFGWQAALAAGLAFAELAAVGPHWGEMLPIGGLLYAPLIAMLAGLVLLAARRPRGPWSWRPVVWCGRVSYPFYLLHQVAGDRLIAALERAGLDANLAVLATLAAMLAAAWLVSRWIERPGLGGWRAVDRKEGRALPGPAKGRGALGTHDLGAFLQNS